MKIKVILCRGIQGSGKTTWAKKYCNDHPNTIRLNRDDIREMLSFKTWSYKIENTIKRVEYTMMVSFLRLNINVVIDDVSNLSMKTRTLINSYLKLLDNSKDLEVVTQDFFIPLQDCIMRDSLRKKPIGEKIIKETYQKYKTIIENKRNE